MMERSPLQDLSCILDKMTFDEHVNVLERFCIGDVSYTFLGSRQDSKHLANVVNLVLDTLVMGLSMSF